MSSTTPKKLGDCTSTQACLIRECGVERLQVDAAIFAVSEHLLVNVLVLRVGGEDLAVLGVNGFSR